MVGVNLHVGDTVNVVTDGSGFVPGNAVELVLFEDGGSTYSAPFATAVANGGGNADFGDVVLPAFATGSGRWLVAREVATSSEDFATSPFTLLPSLGALTAEAIAAEVAAVLADAHGSGSWEGSESAASSASPQALHVYPYENVVIFRASGEGLADGELAGQRGWALTVPSGVTASGFVTGGVIHAPSHATHCYGADIALPDDFDPEGDWELKVEMRYTPAASNESGQPGITFGLAATGQSSGYVEIRTQAPIAGVVTVNWHTFNWNGDIPVETLHVPIHGRPFSARIRKIGGDVEFFRDDVRFAGGTPVGIDFTTFTHFWWNVESTPETGTLWELLAVEVRQINAVSWSTAERAQIRYRLGIDGATAAPTAPEVEPSVVTPAPDPARTNAFLTTYDAQGAKQGGVTVEFMLVDPTPGASGAGASYPRVVFSAMSDEQALLQVTLKRGATYKGRRDKGEWHEFTTTTDTATYALPVILGRPSAA